MPTPVQTLALRSLGGLALAVSILVAPVVRADSSPEHSDHGSSRRTPVLILHDSSGPFGWIGGVHARLLANLVGHFELPVTVMPVEEYQAGTMFRAGATFYLGTTYNNELPAAFRRDALITRQPMVWFKYNLWQMTNQANSLFERRSGFRFEALDQTGYDVVKYKGEDFSKNQLDPELGRVSILDPARATAVVSACRQGTTNCIPYVVRSRNFWYVADSPFSYLDAEDRYVVVSDLLHDMLGINHREQHRALVRIEDVHPLTPPDRMRAIADLLSAEGVPFLVGVIPVYTDPKGYYNQGNPRTVPMSQSPEFLDALRYMIARGAQVVLHGYTHQYDSVPNPYTAVTADDYEFFRVTLDNVGGLLSFQPVPEDSASWARSRVTAALAELSGAGLAAAAWETPHYAASPADYGVFGQMFTLTQQRAVYFDRTGSFAGNLRGRFKGENEKSHHRGKGSDKGSDKGKPDPAPEPAPDLTNGHLATQFFPYVIQDDIYGQKIVPENLGNIDISLTDGNPVRLPADMVRIARKNKAVRDGWASGFFHPFLDPQLLQELVRGIKEQGYRYVPLKGDLR